MTPMRTDYSWNKPPTGRCSREQWDRWCHEMRRRNYKVWTIAQKLGVSENQVLRACERVDEHRYDG